MAATRRIRAVLAAAAVAAGGISALAGVPVSAAEGFELVRVAGDDRYETAAEAATTTFASGATSAVVATGEQFADALAGSYLAGLVGGPILLTQQASLPASTSGALAELEVETVYLLGGTAAVSTAVEEELEGDGYDVQRVAGPNRYDTASRIAQTESEAGVGEVDGETTAILASGTSFADALAAGPAAYAGRFPIVLTTAQQLSPEARDALEATAVEHVVVVGGTAVISDAVVDEVEALGATTERVAGNDRYETAADFADFALANVAGFDATGVDLATGEQFADALAGGPASGELLRPILLTRSTTLSAPTETWLEDNSDTLVDGRVYGGTAAVSQAVVDDATEAGTGDGAPVGDDGQLTSIDTANDTYTFVQEGSTEPTTVTYASSHTFTVDGATATVGGFETAATPGDRITWSSANPTRHELTNVSTASFTSGMVGNVDTADSQFDFINPVTGDILRRNVSWDGVTFQIDGGNATEEDFAGSINEGDQLTIASGSPTVYRLANRVVSGEAVPPPGEDDFVYDNPLAPTQVSFRIGALGDIPTAGSDTATESPGQDDRYRASSRPDSTDDFTVDGNQDATGSDFIEQLSSGDLVSYDRRGGVQTFTLTNRARLTMTGKGADGLNTDGNDIPAPFPNNNDSADGGSFTLVTADGPVEVTYENEGFRIDGNVASEAEFEAAYDPGDGITFRPSDEVTATPQQLYLTNQDLSGRVGDVNTGESATPAPESQPANSYDVLGPDNETELDTVTYSGGENTTHVYQVNGVGTTPQGFEAALGGTGTKTITVQRTTGTGGAITVTHRLTVTT